MKESADVVIMGGGLAGLTLALQLRQRFPALEVVVLERRRHPVPHATHKVGESSVEIGPTISTPCSACARISSANS